MTKTSRFAIQGRIETILRDPSIPVDDQNANLVAARVAQEISPTLEFQTNNEPWFKSYVTIGSLGSVVTAVGTLLTAVSNGDYSGETIGPPITVILTAGFALYGRWAARRPIGG